MKSKPTIRDVARVAGVSQGTVSRVINGQPYVNAETQRRVLDVMVQLGYQPNSVAQSMRTKATRMVGFMIADVTNPVFGSFVKAAEAILHSAGYTLLLANTGGSPTIESELVTILQQRRVDGLILSVGNEHNPALISALREVSFPVVLMDRDLGLPFDAVMADHAKGMYQATHHLLSLGHRRIALITASQSIRPGRERLKGFGQAYLAMGLQPDPALVRSGSLSAEYGFREAHAMLTARRPPTAIIAGGNQILAGVLRAVGMLDLKIPAQLSLISCDDTDLSALYSPPITVISRDLSEMGRTSAELLLARLRNNQDGEPQRVMLPTQTVLRDSCAAPLGFNE
jgi:LacI family transcriptional regulator